MPTSQFTIYTASDPQGPGYITGTSGSLINILDYVLVGGYGTGSYYKAPAGWTKPFTNSGSSITQPAYGCWQQGGGASMSFFVNDIGPGGANGKEASIVGWETITSIAPTATGSTNVGVGLGQFPTPAQSLTNGLVVWRKSVTADTTPRYWIIAADQTTMYIWIWTDDFAGTAYHGMFGDFYSFAGTSDLWRCCIYGRCSVNNPNGQSVNSSDFDYTDVIPSPTNPSNLTGQYITGRQPGVFVPRTAFGSGTSVNVTKRGDSSVQPFATVFFQSLTQPSVPMYGIIQSPNIPDNSFYFSPIEVVEPANPYVLRGRYRGLYFPLHAYQNFSNGQIISGSNDYAGKVFQIVRLSYCGSVWALEISPTVETN